MKESFISKEDFKPKEACGVYGIYLPSSKKDTHEALYAAFKGIHLLQHRGEESSGIITADETQFSPTFKSMGLISNLYGNFHQQSNSFIEYYKGNIALSHTRYSTTGSSTIENAGPFISKCNLGQIAVSHNGNIINSQELKKDLEKKGYKFFGTTDSEIIAHLITNATGNTWEEKISNGLLPLEGSYSLGIVSSDGALYAARDNRGNKPLSIGVANINNENAYAISSETRSINKPFTVLRDVIPGEIVKFSKNGIESFSDSKKIDQAFCSLEIAYFLCPDSRIEQKQLNEIRFEIGKLLGMNFPPNFDIDYVTYIPESAKSSAEGYAKGLSKIFRKDIRCITALLKNRYPTLNGKSIRGFINPNQENRDQIGKQNYSVFDVVNNANIVLFDDSIIRGSNSKGVVNTIKNNVGFMQNGGAKKIHFVSLFPKVISHCNYGIDISPNDRLIARDQNSDEIKIAQELGVDSISYPSPDFFQKAVNAVLRKKFSLCMGCTTGEYPTIKKEATIFTRN